MIENLKVAAYLEDAGEDPLAACRAMKEVGIHYAVIRHVWTSNIKDLSDSGCAKLRKILSDTQITPIAIVSTIGEVPATDLASVPTSTIDRTFALVEYFKVPMLGLTCGTKVATKANDQIDRWLTDIRTRSLAANVSPLIEVSTTSHIANATDLAVLFSKHARLKLLYDPAQLIIRQNINPFIKYWTLLKQHVAAIDVRDYKIGKGYKPIGFGDTHIIKTIKDAVVGNYSGWFFFEPSLGRKHGTAQTKSDVFKMAFSAFTNALDQS